MRTVLVSALVASLVALHASAQTSFMSLGDFGCMPVGGWRAQEELNVAQTFTTVAQSLTPQFILNPGDNFYWCGVQNKSDALWQSTFENVFTDPTLMVPWYSALGNHDYGYPGSATAQIEYVSPNNNRWVLPSRYYYKRIEIAPGVNMSLVVLDTSPCQKMYISTDPSGWDPCGTEMPAGECPGCTFQQNVAAQSCSAQLAWLKQTVAAIPNSDWKVALIHAPASDIDVEDLITPLQQANFDLVVNGHVHLLAHYTVDNIGTYITSGAGCMVHEDARTHKNLGSSSCTSYSKWHTCQIVFQRTVPGFTTHEFEDNYSKLKTTIIDVNGNKIHTVTVQKGNGTVPTPPPGPTPTSPAGGCCFYSDSDCNIGQTCCNEEGVSYDEWACDGSYGQKHNCVWSSIFGLCLVG